MTDGGSSGPGTAGGAGSGYQVEVDSLRAFAGQVRGLLAEFQQSADGSTTHARTGVGSTSFGEFAEATALYDQYGLMRDGLRDVLTMLQEAIDDAQRKADLTASNYENQEHETARSLQVSSDGWSVGAPSPLRRLPATALRWPELPQGLWRGARRRDRPPGCGGGGGAGAQGRRTELPRTGRRASPISRWTSRRRSRPTGRAAARRGCPHGEDGDRSRDWRPGLMSSDITDFNTYSHSALRKMVHALNSGDVMAASDPWRRAAETLKQIRAALDAASNTATDNWQGNSSNAFYDKMTTLANNVNNTASYANDAANTLQMMSEAIDQAKHDMPEEPGFWAQVGNAISDTAQNAVGIQDDSTQTPIKDQKKAEAVAVMQTLANKYRTATPVLKPPAIAIDEQDVPPPEPTASAALTGFVLGTGLGAVGGYITAPENTQVAVRVTGSPAAPTATAPRARAVEVDSTSDSGIKGGIANPTAKPPKSTAISAEAPGGRQVVRPTVGSSASPAQSQIVGSGTGLDSTGVIGSKLPVVGTTGGLAMASVAALPTMARWPWDSAATPGDLPQRTPERSLVPLVMGQRSPPSGAWVGLCAAELWVRNRSGRVAVV